MRVFLPLFLCLNVFLPGLCLADDCTDIGLTKAECDKPRKEKPCISKNYSIKNPFPLQDLVGKSEAQVRNVLGKPDGCEKSKYGRICYYQCGDITIAYINRMADWFTVKPKDTIYMDISISALGLPFTKADSFQNHSGAWLNTNGLLSVQMFAGEKGMVGYFYVKARTP